MNSKFLAVLVSPRREFVQFSSVDLTVYRSGMNKVEPRTRTGSIVAARQPHYVMEKFDHYAARVENHGQLILVIAGQDGLGLRQHPGHRRSLRPVDGRSGGYCGAGRAG